MTVVAPGGEAVAALVQDPAVVVDRERLDSAARAYVNVVRNGRIVEIEIFWDHAKALEAVGLSE